MEKPLQRISPIAFLQKNPEKIIAIICGALVLIQIILCAVGAADERKKLAVLKIESGIVINSVPTGAQVFAAASQGDPLRKIGRTPLLLTKSYEKIELRLAGYKTTSSKPSSTEGISAYFEEPLSESVPILSTLIFRYPLALIAIVLIVILALRYVREAGAGEALPEVTYVGEGGKIGSFRLDKKVGQGAMAEVFQGYSLKDRDRKVRAVKVLFEEVCRHEEFRKRFEREVSILSGLSHPSIVRLYEWGEESGRLFMAMEYVEGRSLEDLLKEGPMAVKDLLRYTLPILDALEHAHSQDIIHRDLKPANILITRRGEVKVADFGLARSANYETITKTDATLGTPAYMPPEQITGARSGGKADLYSLGCILFHCLAGVTPFSGSTAVEMIIRHMNEPPPPLDTLRADIPEQLVILVSRLLEKDPDDRPSSALEVKEAIVFIEKQLPAQGKS